MKVRNTVLANTSMTPVERRMGRFMRAPDGHPGDGGVAPAPAANPSGGPDNASGNNGTANPGDPSQDNNGQDGLPQSFWNSPEDTEPTDDNAPSADSDSGTELGRQVAEGIQNAQLPEVFTREIGEQIAEGNLDGVNESLATHARAVMQASIVQSARIMQTFGAQLLEQVDQRLNGQLQSRDDNESLAKTFPSMRDPAMAPVITGVFNQSLRHTKGNRPAAIEMTRNMLRVMGQKGSQDFGIANAPSDSSDFLGDGPANLVEDLLSANE